LIPTERIKTTNNKKILNGGNILATQYAITKRSDKTAQLVRPQKGHSEKRCEIQGGGQEMAVMVG